MQSKSVAVFAPATVANLGPGYDILGLALSEPGDRVVAHRTTEPGVKMVAVEGSSTPPGDERNTAWVAAKQLSDELRLDWGVELHLEKGLPMGSGLGSSGASAVAAAVAVNALAGDPLSRSELLFACARAEEAACGSAHADNVAPALLGGVVMVRPDGTAIRLKTSLSLWISMVTPLIELPTRKARSVIPAEIPLEEAVHNSAQVASLVYALATADLDLLGRAIDDRIAEPRRAPLIPAFFAVKAAALQAGALGSSISGAGPSIFAVCAGEAQAKRANQAMSQALKAAGLAHRAWTSAVDDHGARMVPH